MRWMLAVAVLGLAALNLDAGRAPQNDPVTIHVDTAVFALTQYYEAGRGTPAGSSADVRVNAAIAQLRARPRP